MESVDQSAIDAHRESVRALAKPGHALAPDSTNATVNNPQWFSGSGDRLRPRDERRLLHMKLKSEYVEKYPTVRQERRAVVLAGPPGAGKSTILETVLGDKRADYLTIDADEFKRALLHEALRDGSYEARIVPDAVRQLEAAGEKFFPLELASLVHEESSMLAKSLRAEAIERGDNVIIDTVLSSESGALQIGAQLETAGYRVEVIDVEVPYEVSEQRIAQRWELSYVAALAQEAGLGGRWVPSEYAREVFGGPDGKSRPEAAAERLASDCGAVTAYRLYRTTVEQGTVSGPRLEVDKARSAVGTELVDAGRTLDGKAAAAKRFAQGQLGPMRPNAGRSPGQTRSLGNDPNPGKPGRTWGPSR